MQFTLYHLLITFANSFGPRSGPIEYLLKPSDQNPHCFHSENTKLTTEMLQVNRIKIGEEGSPLKYSA